MISKSQIKLITSLQQKKYRNKEGLFVAEGPKVISELVSEGLQLHSLFTTESNAASTKNTYLVTEKELQKISFLTTANSALAIFKIPEASLTISEGTILALDAVRDPGNLGTIIRLCDWFAIDTLVCSNDTTDCYNPKVIQATMGSIARVKIRYTDLALFLKQSQRPVYVGCMDGDSVYSENIPNNAIIVMGNEANGISDEVMNLQTKKITIPQFGTSQKTESLNVATATAILLSEFRRGTAIEK